MTPDNKPTPEQRAVALETAAEISDSHGNYTFAKEMRELAAEIRATALAPKKSPEPQ